ncbi:hypothetical protein GPECTOR_2g1547 [Gonium pectorale]|uniref:BZIP domain-containing protein n=1 Tax=Gonium pectorale TaxID=33097 RepID=A0A150H1R5_GONPE|nr:hypothetical protein GPECTOR_2g1547 [Gonium pectorale]|eukprot:KXZ55995.1 hypothetical protein GPECTOR_2g1547 [Gonium pectorale]
MVQENEKEIIALKEENAMLRGRMEGKQLGSTVTLPAEALQSLLQMTGAGNLLAEAAAAAAAGGGAGAGSSSGVLSLGQGTRGGRGMGLPDVLGLGGGRGGDGPGGGRGADRPAQSLGRHDSRGDGDDGME